MTAVTTAPHRPPSERDHVRSRARRASSPTSTVVAGRALRAVPRDLESVIPPVFIALFFFLVNVGTLQTAHRAATSPASTSRRSRCRPRSCSASPACRARRRS